LAHEAFAQGLFRRGLAILNQALQERPGLLEPWFWKTRFLNSVGFNRLAAEMIDGALAGFRSTESRIGLLEEQAFLWAECERGDEAIRSADAALALGSASVRTHYLRGRALGLLGRLEEAREEMTYVLTLDPTNADAQRALTMIDAASRPKEGNRWWQFWKR
jgi:tetratricopeptide (TPR) repeat protein